MNLKHKLFFSVASFITVIFGLSIFATPAFASGNYLAGDVLGQTDYTSHGTGDSSTQYDDPWGSTAIDTVHHRLFVTDNDNNRVLIYNLDSNNNLISHAADYVLGAPNLNSQGNYGSSSTDMYYPTGLAYDSVNNRLFVLNYYSVDVFDFSNGISDGMPASYELGQSGGFGATSCTTDRANFCYDYSGLAFDPTNERLFVEDQTDLRVLVFNVDPSSIQSGEDASNVLGQSNYSDMTSEGGQNGFGSLLYAGIAYDYETHMLFVTDTGDNRVMVFDLSNGITDNMPASYILGQTNNTNTGAVKGQNGFSDPYGLGIDIANNRLFVDDTDECRVMVFDLSNGISNDMPASAVLGQPDFNTYNCSESQGGFGGDGYSNNLAFDPTNERLYVPNYTDNRVLIYDFVHITNPSGSLTTATLDSPYNLSLNTLNSQGTLTYSITSGSLPPGLTLNTATGVISGTPNTKGTYSFEVSVTDNNGTIGSFSEDPGYTITVNANSSAISTVSAPDTGYGTPQNNSPLPVFFSTAGVITLGISVKFIYRRRNT